MINQLWCLSLRKVSGLQKILFDRTSKKALLERKQLHRILVSETWIFGEEYSLTVSDRSLTEVLRRHLDSLGERSDNDDREVLREDGSRGIVDLMFSRMISRNKPDEREYLVVELKRPTQKINLKVTSQVESYAYAVANDERFKDTNTKWVFWALSNEVSEDAKKKSRQRNRPDGLLYEDDENKYVIWVKTWGQVIQEARSRLHFFQEKLSYEVNDESTINYLTEKHGDLLSQSNIINPETSVEVRDQIDDLI